MSEKKRLTDVAIRKLKTPDNGQLILSDGDVPGLSVRVSSNGAKTWCYLYRFAGRRKRMTLGRYPELGIRDARTAAREASALRYQGLDPAHEQRKRERERGRVYDTTFGSLAKRFMREYERGVSHDDDPHNNLPRHRTWKETQQLLDKYVLPELDRVPADEVTRSDLIALLTPICERAPYQANKTFAVVRKLYNWAMNLDLVQSSPCAGLKKPHRAEVRNRPLRDDEIRAFWQASIEMGYPMGDAFRLLLVTGQRRTEVCAMRHDELDPEKNEWILGPERTKAKRRHVIPITPLAGDVLNNVPNVGGDYVFTTTMGRRPSSGYSVATNRLRDLSGIEDFRLHDLRETMATTMRERLGVSIDVISQVLNHAPQGVTQRHYAALPSLEEMRRALTLWDSYLESLLHAAKPENVISFPKMG